MNKYGAVTAIWYRAFWLIHRFLQEYLYIEQVEPATCRAMSIWFQGAADGVETKNGAYRALWGAAESVLAQAGPLYLLGTVEDLEARIPLDQGTLPCDVSRLYAAIWQSAQLCEWDRATIHKVAKRLSKLVPTEPEAWFETEPAPIDDPVARLVRRAFDVMYDHECVDNKICDRSGQIWEQEDQRSMRWIDNERLAREGI